MSAPKDTRRRHSSIVVDGPDRSPNRSMLRAVGFSDADFGKPIVGIASTWSMVTPCNMHIDRLARDAAAGADGAGGKSIIFGTITVSDGISMGTPGMRYSLVSREIIADSIETVAGAEGFDAVVAIGGCDKNMPGCVMALARLDRPGVFVYGGTILPGIHPESKKECDIVSVFEAVGRHSAGKLDDAGLDDLQARVIQFARGVLADGLEDGHDVALLLRLWIQAGQDRAAIDEDRRAVEPGDGHEAAGHVLVATADGHHAVEALAAGDRLDGIGDDLAGDKGVLHALGAHGDAIGYGDRVEDDGFAAGGIGAGRGFAGEAVDVHVARGDHAPGGGDADLGFFEIGAGEADGVQHGAAGGALGAIDDEGGVFAMRAGFGGFWRLGGFAFEQAGSHRGWKE